MSSPVNNFLTLIPASHKVAVISAFSNGGNEDAIVPVLQKTRRSSSTATTESNVAEEPTLPAETEIVASPTETVDAQIPDAAAPVNVPPTGGLQAFLKLGN